MVTERGKETPAAAVRGDCKGEVMRLVRKTPWLSIAAAALLALLVKVAPSPAFGPGAGRELPPGHPSSNQSVTSQAFMYLDAFYVDPKRIVPATLLESAFRSIESQYPEVVIDPAADKRSVTVRARGFDKTFDLSRIDGPTDVAAALDDVIGFVADRLGADVEREKLLYLTVNGALRALDPHTNIFNMKHFKDFKTSTSGSFGGIGFTFNAQDGELVIVSPIPDTPAARAGLQSGDKILYIDGVPTTNMSSDGAVGRMRGEPGTPVTLTVGREGWSEPRDFPIVREVIRIVSVESRYLKGADEAPVIYARVKNFQTDTSGELAAAIRKLETPGTAGVVLDLRDNPGGLLDEAVKLADGFLDEGAIVSTRNRSGRGKVESAGRSDAPFTRLPLVVLVNRGSASASEIVSAALQDKRALLVGERTFGKGSVQQAFPLTDGGGVLVTIAQYLTPGDVSIQSIGVEPDLALEPVLVSDERLLLAPVKDHPGEASLENAFSTWGNARREAVASVRFLRTEAADHAAKAREAKEFKEPTEQEKAAKLAGEFEIRLARRILAAAKGRPDAATRAGLLAAATTVLAKTAPEEQQKIDAAFAARSVDWSAGKAVAGAKLTAKLPQGLVLKAGEKAGVTVALTNNGTETLHRLWGRTDSASPLLRNQDFAFGALAPGQTREWTVPLEVPGGIEERWDTVSLKVQADGADVALIAGGSVETRSRPAPEYAYRYRVTDENLQDKAKTGDGIIEAGERVRLALAVTNRGGAESPLLEVNLSADDKEELYLEAARDKLAKLAAGSTADAPLAFKVVRPLESGRVKVGLSFMDRGAGGFFGDALDLPVGTAYTATGSRVPPRITLGAVPPLVTDAEQVTIAVSASDDGAVKDLIVYRGEKKLAYARNRDNAAPFPLTLTVPLESGSNRIVIIARDDNDIPAQKVLYVHRRGGDDKVAATAPAAPVQP
jgi:carboxyl-terminal processing protease